MASINSVTVLTLNGRRQKVQVTPNTTVMQIIEEVCKKQNLEPGDYNLKHHNHVLDTSVSLRYSGLPNNAQLELVKLETKRQEMEVTVSLVYESGDRLTGTFLPSESLWNVVIALIPNIHIDEKKYPVIVYIHQDISGKQKLQETTLRSLGIMSGRVLLRLMIRNQDDVPHQAYVASSLPHRPIRSAVQPPIYEGPKIIAVTSLERSSVYWPGEVNVADRDEGSGLEQMEIVPDTEDKDKTSLLMPSTSPGPSVSSLSSSATSLSSSAAVGPSPVIAMDTSSSATVDTSSEAAVENEIVIGERGAVAFSLSTAESAQYEDLPADFFDLTVRDVQALFRDLKHRRSEMVDSPLQTAAMRHLEDSKRVLFNLNKYKKTIIRVHFPDRTVLQGIFSPVDKVEAVADFVRGFLENQATSFHLYTTPPKSILEPSSLLLEAHCVPSAVIYFGPEEPYNGETRYLKPEIFASLSSHRAASAAASQTRKLRHEGPQEPQQGTNESPSTSKTDDPAPSTSYASDRVPSRNTGKAPKWFKTSKK